MTTYVVFRFSNHDEGGGWNDFVSAHTDLNHAIVAAEKYGGDDYAQVVDINKLEVVEERFRWREGALMVTKQELDKLYKERDEQIARIQRSRGLIA